ncbi:MAG: hypothetical protein ACRDZR_04210 [Acidimicrobiales bacterium]
MTGHPPRRTALAILVLPVLLVGLGGTAAPAGANPGTLSPGALAAGADHECVVPGGGTPHVAWASLHNPVLSYPDAAAKDEAVVWTGGRWHMLFSYVTHDTALPGGVRWDVATATSPDLAHWSAPRPWPAQAGTVGVASPDGVRDPAGGFVVTYQSNPSAGGQDKVFYRTSPDLEHWSAPHPLAPRLAPQAQDRQIDAALAFTGHGLVLAYKASVGTGPQHFVIAYARSGSLRGPWRLVGRPDISLYGDTVENYELVHAAGAWRLVATSNTLDQPWIFRLDGAPSDPASWLHWSAGRELAVPSQPWDTGTGTSSVGYEAANAAFLCDARSAGGYSYLFYAGSSELTQFDGWGHAAVGVARSRDLVHWQVPPPASG